MLNFDCTVEDVLNADIEEIKQSYCRKFEKDEDGNIKEYDIMVIIKMVYLLKIEYVRRINFDKIPI